MKLSLSWIFDHIKASWKDIEVSSFIEKCSATIVEIGNYHYTTLDLAPLTAAVVRHVGSDQVLVFSQEFGNEYVLPARNVQEGQIYLIKVIAGHASWVLLRELQSTKEGLLPLLSMTDQQFAGRWKYNIEHEDVILEIDNVALTHRPDLWGHRGFAREIGALLNIPLVPLESLLASVPVKQFEHHAHASKESGLSLHVEDHKACRRFAAAYIPQIEYEGSWLWMAHRLARIDYKPIDAVVDATNYVMADLGQPMHAFDANKLVGPTLIAQRAKQGQLLELLDGAQVELTHEDVVISDGTKPVALAGIMGGAHAAVNALTEAVLVEAASFDPQVIRKTASRLKIRTEASARFEKNLDPNQNVIALRRFLHLLDDNTTIIIDPHLIVSLGAEFKGPELSVTHEFLEKKLGVALETNFIKQILSALEFDVHVEATPVITYHIKVPSFRGTKDVLCAEDIAEEVGRFYGLEKIPHTLPALALKPHSVSDVFVTDRIKYHLAFSAQMHEMCNYALFDEEFLQGIGWQPAEAVAVKNPVSSVMYRMVTSLVPNLLKNVVTNSATHAVLNFFECNKVFLPHGAHINEQKSLAGIFYASAIDFYEKKEHLVHLFELLNISVEWVKTGDSLAPWYHPYQTALLMHKHQPIGVAGIAHPYFLQKILPGAAFIFEFNADVLINEPRPLVHFEPLAKYQDTWADVSVLVPSIMTAKNLIDAITNAHQLIFDVQVLDCFEKEAWQDQRSITLRYYARAADKTLDHADIKEIYAAVAAALTQSGAIIR